MNQAEKITAASKSNLAFTLVMLPHERRGDMAVFYAFCRVVDDIADSTELANDEKQRQLEHWKRSLIEPHDDDPPLAKEVRSLMTKYRLRENHLLEIIHGVEMDIEPKRYQTFNDLRLYCYRVASVVGLVSIEIFGCRDEASKRYAVDLGLALQLTNILRDVGQDIANGERIYLPLEDLQRFDYSETDLLARRYNPAFVALMEFEAKRAHGFYQSALEALPAGDRRALRAAEAMRGVYFKLLKKIEADRFHVFEKRYRLNKAQKLAQLFRILLGNVFK